MRRDATLSERRQSIDKYPQRLDYLHAYRRESLFIPLGTAFALQIYFSMQTTTLIRAQKAERSRETVERWVHGQIARVHSYLKQFFKCEEGPRATLDCIIFPRLSSPLGVFNAGFFFHGSVWFFSQHFFSYLPENYSLIHIRLLYESRMHVFQPTSTPQNLRMCASVMLRYRCMFYADDCGEREWKSPCQSIKCVLLLWRRMDSKRRTPYDSGNMLKYENSSFFFSRWFPRLTIAFWRSVSIHLLNPRLTVWSYQGVLLGKMRFFHAKWKLWFNLSPMMVEISLKKCYSRTEFPHIFWTKAGPKNSPCHHHSLNSTRHQLYQKVISDYFYRSRSYANVLIQNYYDSDIYCDFFRVV